MLKKEELRKAALEPPYQRAVKGVLLPDWEKSPVALRRSCFAQMEKAGIPLR